MIARLLGARVILTEQDELLGLLERNLSLNFPGDDSIRSAALDWERPEDTSNLLQLLEQMQCGRVVHDGPLLPLDAAVGLGTVDDSKRSKEPGHEREGRSGQLGSAPVRRELDRDQGSSASGGCAESSRASEGLSTAPLPTLPAADCSGRAVMPPQTRPCSQELETLENGRRVDSLDRRSNRPDFILCAE